MSLYALLYLILFGSTLAIRIPRYYIYEGSPIGPYSIDASFPLFVHYENTSWSCNNASLYSPDPIYRNDNVDAVWKSHPIPIYLVYYGPSLTTFAHQRRSIFTTFLNGVFNSSYWNVMKEYQYNQTALGRPFLAKTVFVDCTVPKSRGGLALESRCECINHYHVNGTVYQESWKSLLTHLHQSNPAQFPLTSQALYVVILDEQVKMINQFTTDKGDIVQDVLGETICGFHTASAGVNTTSTDTLYASVIGLPRSRASLSDDQPASGCWIYPKNKVKSPNGDPSADAAIPILLHELGELLLSTPLVLPNNTVKTETRGTFFSDGQQGPIEKCQRIFSNVVSTAEGDYNLKIQDKRYLAHPVWSYKRRHCAMH